MIKSFSRLSLLCIILSCFLVGCGMGALSLQPQPVTSQKPQPTMLQVTRESTFHASLRSWVITDVKQVQQLFQEIQQLPGHQNNGADSCVNYPYDYSLTFLIGTKSMQQDDLGRYCGTLTVMNGRHFDPTETFNSLLRNMLKVNNLWTTLSASVA